MGKKDVRTKPRETYDSSDRFVSSPRINSLHSYAIYDQIVEISRHIDFGKPVFMGRRKRNHSLGSVQALIVEIALTNREFCEYLKQFMVRGGQGYVPTLVYQEQYSEVGFKLVRPEWSEGKEF